MRTKVTIVCECGADMFERPVKNHRDMIAVTCMSRSCAEHGITRYVRLPEVPDELIVKADELKDDG